MGPISEKTKIIFSIKSSEKKTHTLVLMMAFSKFSENSKKGMMHFAFNFPRDFC